MVRSWIELKEYKTNKVHVCNAADIIDIFDVKGFGYYTIKFLDSHNVDISKETYDYLVGILKPISISVIQTNEKITKEKIETEKKLIQQRLSWLDALIEQEELK